MDWWQLGSHTSSQSTLTQTQEYRYTASSSAGSQEEDLSQTNNLDERLDVGVEAEGGQREIDSEADAQPHGSEAAGAEGIGSPAAGEYKETRSCPCFCSIGELAGKGERQKEYIFDVVERACRSDILNALLEAQPDDSMKAFSRAATQADVNADRNREEYEAMEGKKEKELLKVGASVHTHASNIRGMYHHFPRHNVS